jgi:hypothetical protein
VSPVLVSLEAQGIIFRRSGHNHETHISTKLEEEKEHARLQSKDEIQNWPESTESKTSKGTTRADSERSIDSQPEAMSSWWMVQQKAKVFSSLGNHYER